MKNQWLMLSQLNRSLKEWQTVSQKHTMPRAGWIRTIRTALQMSSNQLAERLGVGRRRIAQLEFAETAGLVTLNMLNKAANAMGCELVYAVVPKNGDLETILRQQAEAVATENVARVAHTMALEDQALPKQLLEEQKKQYIKALLEKPNKKLWDKK